MARVEGVKRVQAILQARASKAGEETSKSVIVGYTQSYALYVHENLEAHHSVGQAKFLEQPAREEADKIGGIVRTALTKGASVSDALLLGGLYLQRASQQLVPVDTGALKSSAFTRFD